MATAGTALDELLAEAESAEMPVGEDEGGPKRVGGFATLSS